MMAAFDCAMEAWKDAAEAFSKGYAAELAQFKLEHPMPQLREFMNGSY